MSKFLQVWTLFLKRVKGMDVNNLADADPKTSSSRRETGRRTTDVNLTENCNPPATLFQEVKPLAWVMFMNQLWPVQANKEGRVEASIRNVTGVSTLLMFGALLPLHVIVIELHTHFRWDGTESFATFIYHLTYPAILHHHLVTPLIAWVPAPSLAAYFNAWTEFQDLWYRRLKSPLTFHHVKKRSILTAIHGVVSPFLVSVVCFTLIKSFRIYEFPTFMMSSAYLFLRSASWADLCAAHEEVANQLGEILTNTLKSGHQTEELRAVRATWLSLQSLSSKLASGKGAIPPLHYTSCLLGQSLLTSVGVLMAALRSAGTGITGAQFLLAFNNLFRVGKMHQAAYKASYAVKWSVLRPLLSSKLLDDNIRDEEVLSFLATVDRNPAVITIGDLTNCSRSALVAFVSMFVTYIVVLIQFAYSVSA